MCGPLAGITVVDASNLIAGPVACQVLGDFGADVVKIEHPRNSDGLRELGRARNGTGLWWKVVSRNKRVIGLDLGDARGQEIFRRLVGGADVLVENFRPGTMESWGIGYREVSTGNPGLVMVHITGFGRTGPYAHRPAFGTLIEAMSGFAAATGEPDGPPTLPPLGLADTMAGISAALAAVMAIYHRDTATGKGQEIDVSILEPLVSMMSPNPTVYDQLGELPPRIGNRSELNAPRNLYRTGDGGWVAMSTSTREIAERVMNVVGHPEVIDEPWFADGRGRVAHGELLDTLVSDWIAQRSRREVIAAFEKAEAAVGPVYDVAELMADPHAIARNIFIGVDDEDVGRVMMPNVLFRMGDTPGSVRHTGRRPGADTDSVLGALGYEARELDQLRDAGVIG